MKASLRYSILLQFTAALALSACGSIPTQPTPGQIGAVIDASGVPYTSPGASTIIDDKALIVALQSADTIATSVDALVAVGAVQPGSERALAIRSGLIRLRRLLTAASAAQRAGEAQTYAQALTDAARAAQDITAAIRGQ